MAKNKKNNNYTGLGIGVAGGGLYGLGSYFKKDVGRQLKESTKTLQDIEKGIAQEEKDINMGKKYIKEIKDKYGNSETFDTLSFQYKNKLNNNIITLPGLIRENRDNIKKLKKEITLKEKNSISILRRELETQERERKMLMDEIEKIDKTIKNMDKLKNNVKQTMKSVSEEKKRMENRMMTEAEFNSFKKNIDKKIKDNENLHKIIKKDRELIKQRDETIRKIKKIDKRIESLERQISKIGHNSVKETEIINLRSKYSKLEKENLDLVDKLTDSKRALRELEEYLKKIESEVNNTSVLDEELLASAQKGLEYEKNNTLPTWQKIVKNNNIKMKAADYIGKAGIGVGIAGASKFIYDKYQNRKKSL